MPYETGVIGKQSVSDVPFVNGSLERVHVSRDHLKFGDSAAKSEPEASRSQMSVPEMFHQAMTSEESH